MRVSLSKYLDSEPLQFSHFFLQARAGFPVRRSESAGGSRLQDYFSDYEHYGPVLSIVILIKLEKLNSRLGVIAGFNALLSVRLI